MAIYSADAVANLVCCSAVALEELRDWEVAGSARLSRWRVPNEWGVGAATLVVADGPSWL